MISIRHEVADRPDVTAQLVGDHDPRRAKPVDQPLQEPAGGLCITLLLHENVEHIPIRVDCPPKPELHAIDRNNDFIQVPFVTGARPVALDAIGEMAAKPVHPLPYGLPADQYAPLGQKILDIALSHPGVKGLHDLRTRSSGNRVFIQMHLEMDGDMSLLDAHTISDAVEASVLEAFANAEVLIHEDPEGLEEEKAVFH